VEAAVGALGAALAGEHAGGVLPVRLKGKDAGGEGKKPGTFSWPVFSAIRVCITAR
jgi:hypothetical protein